MTSTQHARLLRSLIGCCMITLLSARLYCQAPTPKDKVMFKNGDVSTGTLTKVAAATVTFKGDLTGDITYQWTDIDRIEVSTYSVKSPGSPESRAIPGQQTFATILRDETTTLYLVHNDSIVKAIPASTTNSNVVVPLAGLAATPAPQLLKIPTWTGSLSSQDTVTRATQDNYQLGASLHLARETQNQKPWRHQQLFIDAQANFSEARKAAASPVRTALYDGAVEDKLYTVDSELLNNFQNTYNSAYLFALGDWYHNLSLGINFQQSYGIGFGWQRSIKGKPKKTGDQLLQLFGFDGDLRYSYQQLYSPGTTYNLAATGLSENYAIVIPWKSPKPLELYERISIIPSFNETRALEVRGMSGLVLPLTCRLSIGPKVTDDYFRNAPPTSKQNYLQPSFSLTYNFSPLPAPTANRCKATR